MLPLDGPCVLPPSVTAADLARALGTERRPLALAPSDATGWFGGTHVACFDPIEVRDGVTLTEAAATLEAVMRGSESRLAVAVLPYDGTIELRVYGGGLVLTPGGWRAWGERPRAPVLLDEPVLPDGSLLADATTDLDEVAFRAGVEAIRELVAAGEVYVVNLTRRVSGQPLLTASEAFRALLARAAAPMSAYLGGPSRALASVSPERFLAIERDERGVERAFIEPIKGTRPRGDDPVSDEALATELAADEKEHAEHVMIVDLERNDLGRVALPGSVRVEPFLRVFATPYCHQLVSRVTADLDPRHSLADTLVATFPCGSVTGAPKLAAMRVIAELERSPRGAYTGALLVALPGALDASVLIRTLEYSPDGRARWGTGCGITVDSDADAEWRESELKAVPVTGA